MAVIDANLLIALEGRNVNAAARLSELLRVRQSLRLPAAAWIEYLAGVPHRVQPMVEADLDATTRFEPFDRPIAAVALRLQSDLLTKGKRLPWHDLQIAATAIHHGEPLVSNDTAFDRVPGLTRISF